MAIARAHLLPTLTARDGLRLSVVEGVFASFQGTFTTGVILTGFALMLGAQAWALGLLAAVPALCQVSQLIAAWILGAFGHRKALCVWTASAGRYMWLPIALIPFLPLGNEARLALFFVLLAASTLLGQMAGIAWSDWMAEAVPAGERGRYFGFRNAMVALAGMAALALGTRFLESLKAYPQKGFFLLLVTAVACGAVCHMLLTLQPEPASARQPTRRGLAAFQSALARPAFVRLLAVAAGWFFVMNLTAPFTYAYALQHLHLGYAVVGLHAMVVTGLSVVFQPLWGRAIDRVGAQRVFAWCALPICLHPLYWVVAVPGFTGPIWLDAVSSGVFWSGFALATSTLLMEAAPTGERAGYMGLYNTATGIAISLGALTGGGVLALMGDRAYALGPYAVTALQVVCLLAGGMRLAVYLAMRRLPAVAAPTVQIETWEAKAAPLHPSTAIAE